MALPSVRSMPVVNASWHPSRRAWLVTLPGGIVMPCRTEFDVEELVAKHAPGTSIRWLRPRSPEVGS